MKTPREILLARHRAAEPKLDAVSRSVVNNIAASSARPSFSLRSLPHSFWREVILPSRRIWVGFAAAWAIILAANLDLRAGSPRLTASIAPAAARNFMSIREQENIVTAFNSLPEPAPVAPPKSHGP